MLTVLALAIDPTTPSTLYAGTSGGVFKSTNSGGTWANASTAIPRDYINALQLHETLEKVAWEAFGDLSERIVREAVERIEQVAWDVIPRLAQTLIREEIRRLKGEE